MQLYKIHKQNKIFCATIQTIKNFEKPIDKSIYICYTVYSKAKGFTKQEKF